METTSCIFTIKEKTNSGLVFTFNHITKQDVTKEVKDLGVSKASQENYIPAKINKENTDNFYNFIQQSFNHMIDVCIYLESHKLKNITSIFKKGQKNSNGNYRSVSILPNISKFTKDIYLNKYKITENIFSKLKCTVLKISLIEK